VLLGFIPVLCCIFLGAIMKKMLALFTLSLLSSWSIADSLTIQTPLDKIAFQLSDKEWVKTESALLTINVNATLTQADLVKARSEIMANLNKIATGEWHIIQFDRSQDSSGLEKLVVQAQARISQSLLTALYEQAKKVSKPGATYTVSTIEFKPSLQEIQRVKTALRERLYHLVDEELARLNKLYNHQNYSINRLYLIEGDAPPMQTKAYPAAAMRNMVLASASEPMAVSNEITMTAMVEVGSMRQGSTSVSNN
jgi:hypothetical protein